jgi:hypothetical protein
MKIPNLIKFLKHYAMNENETLANRKSFMEVCQL